MCIKIKNFKVLNICGNYKPNFNGVFHKILGIYQINLNLKKITKENK